jgi:streptogramin lyase
VAAGVLWATDADAHALWRIDTATGHAERVAVGG